jgi:hypothetical protein
LESDDDLVSGRRQLLFPAEKLLVGHFPVLAWLRVQVARVVGGAWRVEGKGELLPPPTNCPSPSTRHAYL